MAWLNKFQAGGAAPQAPAQNDIQSQATALVQAAMNGDQNAQAQINQIMQAAAAIQQAAQQMQGGAQTMKCGGKAKKKEDGGEMMACGGKTKKGACGIKMKKDIKAANGCKCHKKLMRQGGKIVEVTVDCEGNIVI